MKVKRSEPRSNGSRWRQYECKACGHRESKTTYDNGILIRLNELEKQVKELLSN